MTEPIDDRQKSDRGLRGWFAPSNKASPGRPPGRGPVAEWRATLTTDLDKIIDTLRTHALAGDAQAIRIILDRVLPAPRPIEMPTTLTLPADGTLADQARAVIQAAADGDLALAQAAQIVAALGGVAKIIEATELVIRIETPEEKHAAKKPRTLIDRPGAPGRSGRWHRGDSVRGALVWRHHQALIHRVRRPHLDPAAGRVAGRLSRTGQSGWRSCYRHRPPRFSCAPDTRRCRRSHRGRSGWRHSTDRTGKPSWGTLEHHQAARLARRRCAGSALNVLLTAC